MADISKLKLGNDVYKLKDAEARLAIATKSTVVANPTTESTLDITKIEIDSVVYNLSVTADRANVFSQIQTIKNNSGQITLDPGSSANSTAITLIANDGKVLVLDTEKLVLTNGETSLSLAIVDIATKDDAKQFSTVDMVPVDLGTDKYVFVKINK